jgi:hypothetical protein
MASERGAWRARSRRGPPPARETADRARSGWRRGSRSLRGNGRGGLARTPRPRVSLPSMRAAAVPAGQPAYVARRLFRCAPGRTRTCNQTVMSRLRNSDTLRPGEIRLARNPQKSLHPCPPTWSRLGRGTGTFRRPEDSNPIPRPGLCSRGSSASEFYAYVASPSGSERIRGAPSSCWVWSVLGPWPACADGAVRQVDPINVAASRRSVPSNPSLNLR